MVKTTMGTKLPRKLEMKMQTVGEQIRLARLRRNMSIAQVAERATCSPVTINRVEKGPYILSFAFFIHSGSVSRSPALVHLMKLIDVNVVRFQQGKGGLKILPEGFRCLCSWKTIYYSWHRKTRWDELFKTSHSNIVNVHLKRFSR